MQKYGCMTLPNETFNILVVGEQASCCSLLGAFLRREDLLAHQARSVLWNDAAANDGSEFRILSELNPACGQVFNFVLDQDFLSSSSDEAERPVRAGAQTTLAGVVGEPQHADSSEEVEQEQTTVQRQKRNDCIMQFIRAKKHELDAVWFCFSSRGWLRSTPKEAR